MHTSPHFLRFFQAYCNGIGSCFEHTRLLESFYGITSQKVFHRSCFHLDEPQNSRTWSFASGNGLISNSCYGQSKKLLRSNRPLTAFFNALSRSSPCLTKGSNNDWKAFRNYSTCCERLIGQMKDVLTKKKANTFGRY